MGADLRTVDLANGHSVTYDFDMPVKALRALMRAGTSGDLDTLINGFVNIVVEWDYEGDPSDPESWDLLRRSAFNEIVMGVMADLGDEGKKSGGK